MRTELREKRAEKIVSLRGEGLTLKAIGERFGLTVSGVSKIIQDEVSHKGWAARRGTNADN